MKIKHYKPLHYLLIILLMLAPMRSAMALHLTPCDMAAMDMMDMEASPVSMLGHDMHTMPSHDMAREQDTSAQVISDKADSAHRCCCCDNGCSSNCDMGMSVSMIMQASPFSPVFVKASSFSAFASATLVRALTPPPRPPASFVI